MVVSFYSTSDCNLKCSYCYINKQSHIHEYDKVLEESFKTPEKYLELFKKTVPTDMQDVSALEIWGGEPLLHLERTLPTLDLFIKEYHNIEKVFFSTNFSHTKAVPNILKLLEMLNTYKDRCFTIQIQLSIDGPPEITDVSRGIGVTKRALNNLDLLMHSLSKVELGNVNFRLMVKPTLDINSLRKLENKEYCIEYFKFFEDTIVSRVLEPNNPKITIGRAPIPNLAVPHSYTQDDGILFSRVCKNLYELTVENSTTRIFKHYMNVCMYTRRMPNMDTSKYLYSGGYCSAGLGSLILLPRDQVAVCHRSIGDLVDNFYDEVNDKVSNGLFIIMDDHRNNYDKIVKRFKNIRCGCTSMTVDLTTLIRTLASVGQIDTKYLDEDTARIASYFIISQASLCIHANYEMTKSLHLMYTGYLKLFLNGAIDHIYKSMEVANELFTRK